MKIEAMYLAYAKSGLDKLIIEHQLTPWPGDWELTESLGNALATAMPGCWHDIPTCEVLYELCELEIPAAIVQAHQEGGVLEATEDELWRTLSGAIAKWKSDEMAKQVELLASASVKWDSDRKWKDNRP